MDESQTSEFRYLLLHKLPPARAEELENRLLLDGEFGLLLESEENDLLDDFSRGHLSAEDAALVERYLLGTPDAQCRLEFAKSLSEVATSSSTHRRRFAREFTDLLRTPAFGIGLAACMALLALAIFLRRQPAQPEAAHDQKQAAPPLPVPIERHPPSTDGDIAQSFAIVLLNENRRGAQQRTYTIPSGVKRVRIQCEIPASNSSSYFAIVIRDEAGNHLADFDGLEANAAGVQYLEVAVPSNQMKSGEYSASVYAAANPTRPIVAYDFVVK